MCILGIDGRFWGRDPMRSVVRRLSLPNDSMINDRSSKLLERRGGEGDLSRFKVKLNGHA